MKPWELVHSHRYEEAILLYRSRLARNPNDSGTLGELGVALLCVKQFKDALSAFQQAGAISASELKGHSAYLEEIATAQWLLGLPQESK